MFQNIISQLLQGMGNTILLFVIVLIFSIPLGLLICFGSMSKIKVIKAIFKTIIWIIRGSPLMLQVILVSFIPYYLLNIKNIDLASFFNVTIKQLLFIYVCIAFIINYACYFAEIFRSGIESIDKGQYEAGMVLGLNKRQIFFKIIFLQFFKRVVPPMSNEIITLVKDTALAEVLGVVELLNAANHAVNQYVVLTPLIYAAIFYLLFNGLLTILLGQLEKKLKYFEG